VASDSCGIDDKGLIGAKNLKILYCNGNSRITTVDPFANSLLVLLAYWYVDRFIWVKSGITDAGLVNARNIRVLEACYNSEITTVEPFAGSLVELCAAGVSGISDTGLRHVNKLRIIDIGKNMKITDGKPFANSIEMIGYSVYERARRDLGLGDKVQAVTWQLPPFEFDQHCKEYLS
jgi:hypothetical protein